MRARAGRLLPLLLILALAGCAGALRWSPDYHEVQPGDTLYSIAWRYNVDYRELAAWNNLGNGSLIHPGQRIKLTGPPVSRSSPPGSPATTAKPPPLVRQPAKPQIAEVPREPAVDSWQWPTAGSVVTAFGAAPETESGIEIGGRRGQTVRAAAEGQVVYSGSGLVGYGQLLIVKRNASYLSAYGHNERLLVKEGDRVKAGQEIGRMGLGPGQRPVLHFEIRRNGQPVNPMKYLPRR